MSKPNPAGYIKGIINYDQIGFTPKMQVDWLNIKKN